MLLLLVAAAVAPGEAEKALVVVVAVDSGRQPGKQ